MNEEFLPDILTIHDLSKYLNLGTVNTYKLVKQKDFPLLSIGNTIKIPKKEFLIWLNKKIERRK